MRTVGIDFGTSTIVIAVREDSSPARIISLGKAVPWMPSLAAVTSKGEIVVGVEASKQPLESQIESAKTLLGRGEKTVKVGSFEISVQEIVEALLRSAIEVATSVEPDLFEKGSKVFACCPSIWSLGPRKTLTDAFSSIGVPVEVTDLLEEPLAAGMGWIQEQISESSLPPIDRLLVFDAGGGTLDVGLLDFGLEEAPESNSLRKGSVESLFVLSSESLQAAGDQLDSVIASHLVSTFPEISPSGEVDTAVLRAARQLKEDLSRLPKQEIPVGPKKSVVSFDRDGLEKLFAEDLKHLIRTACEATKAAMIRFDRDCDPVQLRRAAINDLAKRPQHVLMVGGTSLIPSLQAGIKKEFGSATLHVSKNPQLAVAIGLTYAPELTSLNMPRPPLRLIAEVSQPDGTKSRVVIHEAFQPLYSAEALLRGETRLGAYFRFEERDSTVRFFAEGPGRSNKSFALSPEDWPTPVNFKYYATGEVVISSRVKHYRGLVKGWPQLGRSSFDLVPSSPGSWYRNEPDWWRFK